MAIRPLTLLEQRVLGTLMEKARTVPDSYPLTLNAVVSGCNQKSSREPAMQVTDGDAQEALDELKRLSLVFETSGGRATRFEHNFERAYAVPGASAALLGLLMLRGPQTAGELRIHSERWHRFADIGSVEAFLDELAERAEEKGGPLVLRLPRAPGAREARWVALVGGPVDVQMYAQAGPADTATPATGLAARVEALEAAVAALQAEWAGLRGG